MRILVVEDERVLADGLRRGLEAEGFAVDVAAGTVQLQVSANAFCDDTRLRRED